MNARSQIFRSLDLGASVSGPKATGGTIRQAIGSNGEQGQTNSQGQTGSPDAVAEGIKNFGDTTGLTGIKLVDDEDNNIPTTGLSDSPSNKELAAYMGKYKTVPGDPSGAQSRIDGALLNPDGTQRSPEAIAAEYFDITKGVGSHKGPGAGSLTGGTNYQDPSSAWSNAGGTSPPNSSWLGSIWNGTSNSGGVNNGGYSGGGYNPKPTAPINPRTEFFNGIQNLLERNSNARASYTTHHDENGKHLDIRITGIEDNTLLSDLVDRAWAAGFEVNAKLDEKGNTVIDLTGGRHGPDAEKLMADISRYQKMPTEERKAREDLSRVTDALVETGEAAKQGVQDLLTRTNPETGEQEQIPLRDVVEAVSPSAARLVDGLIAGGEAIAEAYNQTQENPAAGFASEGDKTNITGGEAEDIGTVEEANQTAQEQQAEAEARAREAQASAEAAEEANDDKG